MNNIERFHLLKELQTKKAALHKENLLSYFEWNKEEPEEQSAFEKVVSYSRQGYSLYKLIQQFTSKDESPKE